MRAVQITEFGGPEVLTVVDVPEPEVGKGRTLHYVSAAWHQLRRHPPPAVAQLT